MADLQKVIRGLEHHRRCQCSFGKDDICPYWCEENDSASLCSDALELLKAQRPRVLTVDEVKASNGKDLILEYRPWGCEDSIVTAVTIEGCGSRGVSFVMSVSCEYTAYNRDHSFGWRCWNKRPTDEQRKAVKWDD